MNGTLKKISAFILALCMLFSFSAAAFAQTDAQPEYSSPLEYAAESETPVVSDSAQSFFASLLTLIKKLTARFVNLLSNILINDVVAKALVTVVPDGAAVADYDSFELSEYGNFYEGTGEFLDEPAAGAVWQLGYSEQSIMPADFGEKPYAKGAYLPYMFGDAMYTDDDGQAEELRVRTIVMSDSSGRGNVVFAVLDAMGICNADVRLIREALSDFAAANNIVSINVSATHIHTGIDSQGVWTDPVGVLFNNITSDEVKYGVDRSFLQAVIDGTKRSVIEAVGDMKTGSLYYSSMDIADYVRDRTAPIAIDTNLYKLEFIPFDSAAEPTLIASFGCHPESSSYDWKTKDENGKTVFDKNFSADFVWYMEKVINAAGYNFIYIQGDVCTATSSRGLTSDGLDATAHDSALRYGYELGYIALTMNMNRQQRIEINRKTGDRLGVQQHAGEADYTVWYDGLETVAAESVKPMLNIRTRQFTVEIENNAMAVIGKTSISDNFVLSDGKKYYTVSEVGYMEVGDSFKVYISPGETFGELLMGGSGLEGFPYDSIRDTVGEDVIVFDLMNDAAGYVANDANYVMLGLQYNELTGELDSDSWCLISYGKHAASTFISNFYEVVDSVR